MRITVFPNLGNTCYLNSVLQCFIYNKEILNEQSPFITELKNITDKIDLSQNEEHKALVINIKNLIPLFPFRRFEQQDAHECILSFLELLKENGKGYHGETKTTIKCLCCENITSVLEPFNSINLSINAKTLTEMFMKYLAKEIHNDSENLYFCEKCNTTQQFEKKISLNKLPDNLIIVLKRYTFTGTKILSEVTFDETLKIRESLTGSIKDYILSGIINHNGNLYNGHYTNYICIHGVWLFIDDEVIKIEKYTCKDAYILFYKIK